MLKELKNKQNTINVVRHKESQSETTFENSESEDSNAIEKLEEAFQNFELKRITNKCKINPTSLTKNWYPRPTPPDIQFEERNFQNQFSVAVYPNNKF